MSDTFITIRSILASLVLSIPLVVPFDTFGAPDTSRAAITIGFSTSFEQQRDDLLVPLRFQGAIALLAIGTAWERGPRSHAIGLTGGFGGWRDRFDNGAAGTLYSVRYRLLHDAPDIGPLSFSAGGRLGWTSRENVFYRWDESHGYHVTAIAAGPAFRLSHGVKRGAVVAECALDLAGLVSRSPEHRISKIDSIPVFSYHFTSTNRNYSARSPVDHVCADWSLTWHTTVKRSRMNIGYAGALQRTREPKTYREVRHGLMLSFALFPFHAKREIP